MLGTISHLWTLVGQAAVENTEKVEAVVAATPFYKSGWFLTLVGFIALIAVWWLAHQIAKAIKMPNYGSRLATIGVEHCDRNDFHRQ